MHYTVLLSVLCVFVQTVTSVRDHCNTLPANKPVSGRLPPPDNRSVHILVALPIFKGELRDNPFELTQSRAKPVLDVVLEDVYNNRQLLPADSMNLLYGDTMASDTCGPHMAIMAFMENRLDVVIGYANVYALAPVARLSKLWRGGVPLLTTTALVSTMDDKSEYRLLTRMSGTYKVLGDALQQIMKNEHLSRHYAFIFSMHANPNAAATQDAATQSECFFQMTSIRGVLTTESERGTVWDYMRIIEGQATNFSYVLQKSSMVANG